MDLAIVDTSVVILLLSRPGAESEAIRIRRERAEIAVGAVLKQGATLAMPTPVIAELCKGGPGSLLHQALMKAIRRRIRTLPLTVAAADAAGAARRAMLLNRSPGEERGAVLYDALIFGIAHERRARWLLTANARDYARLATDLSSTIEIVDTDAAPKGQLSLVHQGAAASATSPTAPAANRVQAAKKKTSRKR